METEEGLEDMEAELAGELVTKTSKVLVEVFRAIKVQLEGSDKQGIRVLEVRHKGDTKEWVEGGL